MLHGDPSGHLEADFFPRPANGEEVVAGLVVGVDGDLMLHPLGLPQVNGDHVGDEFEICNLKVGEIIWDGAREVLVVLVVVTAEAWSPVLESVRRSIQ